MTGEVGSSVGFFEHFETLPPHQSVEYFVGGGWAGREQVVELRLVELEKSARGFGDDVGLPLDSVQELFESEDSSFVDLLGLLAAGFDREESGLSLEDEE